MSHVVRPTREAVNVAKFVIDTNFHARSEASQPRGRIHYPSTSAEHPRAEPQVSSAPPVPPVTHTRQTQLRRETCSFISLVEEKKKPVALNSAAFVRKKRSGGENCHANILVGTSSH